MIDKNETREAIKRIERTLLEWEENRLGSREACELLAPDIKTVASYFELIHDKVKKLKKRNHN